MTIGIGVFVPEFVGGSWNMGILPMGKLLRDDWNMTKDRD